MWFGLHVTSQVNNSISYSAVSTILQSEYIHKKRDLMKTLVLACVQYSILSQVLVFSGAAFPSAPAPLSRHAARDQWWGRGICSSSLPLPDQPGAERLFPAHGRGSGSRPASPAQTAAPAARLLWRHHRQVSWHKPAPYLHLCTCTYHFINITFPTNRLVWSLIFFFFNLSGGLFQAQRWRCCCCFFPTRWPR